MRHLAVFLLGCASLFGASPNGKWNLIATTESGREYKLTLTLESNAGVWSGRMENDRGSMPVSELRVDERAVSYQVSAGDAAYHIKLTLIGGAFQGSFTGTNGLTGKITASRATATAAGFAGVWNGRAVSASGTTRNVRLILRDTQQIWTGTVASGDGEADLVNVRVAGPELSFEIPVNEGTYRVRLTLAGASATGTYTGPANETGDVTLNR